MNIVAYQKPMFIAYIWNSNVFEKQVD